MRLLQHWRQDKFSGIRPFFCQVEAVETAIWLTEVAPQSASGKRLLEKLAAASRDANPELMRIALKLATGAGKTTVMAMLIAWQTVNEARYRSSKHFTRGFLVCAPGLTIKDRLRVLHRFFSCHRSCSSAARFSRVRTFSLSSRDVALPFRDFFWNAPEWMQLRIFATNSEERRMQWCARQPNGVSRSLNGIIQRNFAKMSIETMTVALLRNSCSERRVCGQRRHPC